MRDSLLAEKTRELQLTGFATKHAADVLDILLTVHQSGKKLPERIVHTLASDQIDDARLAGIPDKYRVAGFDACINWLYRVK